MARDDPERHQLAPDRDDRGVEHHAVRRWLVDGHQSGGGLMEHALGFATVGASDDPARRVGGRRIDATGGERRVTREEGVMVVGPQDGPPPRRGPFEVVRGGPATPPVGIPAVAVDPRVGIRGESGMRVGDSRHPLGERRHGGEVDLAERAGGLGEMEVRVGQSGEGDGIGLEHDPPSVRVRPRLEVDLGPGERDATVADTDRLHPAEPRGPGEGRDPPGDEGVERHRLVPVGRIRRTGQREGLLGRACA